MTTLRQVRRLVTPLIERNADLVLVRQTVVIKPVHHILRGIMIDRTSDKTRCRPRWIATELFTKHDFIPVGLGELLSHPDGLWWLSDPKLPAALADIIERDALPKLRRIEKIRDYAQAAIPTDPQAYIHYAAADVLYLLAEGNLGAAVDVLAAEKQAATYWMPQLRQLGLDRRLPALRDRLGVADRAKLASLLHEWEAYTVDKLKLRDVWEPTPFPLELASDASD